MVSSTEKTIALPKKCNSVLLASYFVPLVKAKNIMLNCWHLWCIQRNGGQGYIVLGSHLILGSSELSAS